MSQQQNLPSKILVVDDDPSIAQSLEEPLSRYNIKVDKAPALETAFYLFNQNRYDVVLVELEFEPLPGLALVQKWRQHDSVERRMTSFIVMSGNKTTDQNEGLIRELGDLEVLSKPFGVIQILPYLSRAMALRIRTLAYYDLKAKILDYYEKKGDFDKAAEQVQKRLPDLGPKGLSMLYDLYERGNKLEEALAVVTPMLDKDPNNIALLNARARLLMRLGRFQEAKVVLEKADELAPQNIARLNDMATAYIELKEADKSVKTFKQIMKLTPENPDAKFEMYAKLYDGGFDNQAIQFGKETAKPMEIVRHYNNKGVMLSKDGNSDNALVEYRRALGFYPKFKENYRIHFNIALAHLQLKTREGVEVAVKNLKMCLELEPTFEKAKKTLEAIEKSATPKPKAS